MNVGLKPYNCIVVCGPTASGKTRLGVQIAQSVNGEIISVDSRQVYRFMDIGTGKDLQEYTTEKGSVPCHLIDIAHPSTIYTLSDYQKDFYNCFDDIIKRGKTPVAVGGTGLYLEAVLKQYAIPKVKENPVLRSQLILLSKQELQEMLKREEPDRYEKTDLSSKKRIVRALEVARSEDGQGETILNPPKIDPLILYVVRDRTILRERIEKRLLDRLQNGMVDEVKNLLGMGVTPERLHLMGMEYRQICRYLQKEISYDEMFVTLRQEIFHLAKRQNTWFRGMGRRGLEVREVRGGEEQEQNFVL